jgi:putative membrane protein
MKLDPFAVAVLLITGGLYAAGALRVRPPKWESAAFGAGWLMLAIALLSPIATLSDVLFSVHMTQHELLMLIAAPLLTLGRPLGPVLRVFSLAWRQRLAHLTHARVTSFLLAPAAVFVVHAAALWMWHAPPLYEAAVRSDAIHLLQHLCFTGTACLFWWGMLRGSYGRLGYGASVLYIFATAIHSGGLGALLTFATRPIYPLYAQQAHAQRVDALADQQLAGLIMWIPAGTLLLVIALAFFVAWMGEAERRRRLSAFSHGVPPRGSVT